MCIKKIIKQITQKKYDKKGYMIKYLIKVAHVGFPKIKHIRA